MLYQKFTISTLLLMFGICLHAQTETEYQIIEKVITNEITPWPNDTLFRKDGTIKKVKSYGVPDIVLQIDTEKPFSANLEDTSLYNIFRFKQGLTSLNKGAFNDFYFKNISPIRIDTIKGFTAKIIYKSRDQIMNIFERGDWRLYYKKFGHKPYVRISRPGLNSEKDKAFIYYRVSRGGLSGYGIFLTLEKKDGDWIIKESMLGDIS